MTISDTAAQRINGLCEDKPGHGLKVKVVAGGCSGLQLKMDISLPHEKDKVIEHNGAKVFIDQKSFLFLSKSEVNYHDSLQQAGFSVGVPEAKHTCGCGKSFAV